MAADLTQTLLHIVVGASYIYKNLLPQFSQEFNAVWNVTEDLSHVKVSERGEIHWGRVFFLVAVGRHCLIKRQWSHSSLLSKMSNKSVGQPQK